MSKSLRDALMPVILIISAAVIFRPGFISSVWGRIWRIAAPFAAGILFAAVINPAVMKTEKLLLKTGLHFTEKVRRGVSIALVYLAIAGTAAAVVMIIIPRLAKSITLFVNSFDSYYSTLKRRMEIISQKDRSGLFVMVDSIIAAAASELPAFFRKTFSGAAGIIRTAAGIAVGFVMSVYILADKERITGFIDSGAQVILSEKTYLACREAVTAVYTGLVSFISGQLTEAAVLGSLCFIGMLIFGFEYPLLISVIIGVTALVPVVGAIAGAVPAMLVLFLVKPSSALWFLVFIIVLQQLENNLIYPKVVGRSVGLPPFLVFTAIVTGAQLGGAGGILVGIPLLSAVYVLIGNRIRNSSRNVPGI